MFGIRGDSACVLFHYCTQGCGRTMRPAFRAPSLSREGRDLFIGANGASPKRARLRRPRAAKNRGDDARLEMMRVMDAVCARISLPLMGRAKAASGRRQFSKNADALRRLCERSGGRGGVTHRASTRHVVRYRATLPTRGRERKHVLRASRIKSGTGSQDDGNSRHARKQGR